MLRYLLLRQLYYIVVIRSAQAFIACYHHISVHLFVLGLIPAVIEKRMLEIARVL